jgi:hypothetical protein
MKFIIEVKLRDINICDGCPCVDAEVDNCQVFKTELKKRNCEYLRCTQCITKFGGK